MIQKQTDFATDEKNKNVSPEGDDSSVAVMFGMYVRIILNVSTFF